MDRPTITESLLSVPVVAGNVVLTSGFRVPNRPNHHGVDFGARPRGKPPILSFGDGVITTLQNNNPTAGNWLEVTHDDGLISTYMHLDTISAVLSLGAKVHQGQQIGTMGTTGESSGVHLHFELRRVKARNGGANAIDPMPFLLRVDAIPTIAIDVLGNVRDIQGRIENDRTLVSLTAITTAISEVLGLDLIATWDEKNRRPKIRHLNKNVDTQKIACAMSHYLFSCKTEEMANDYMGLYNALNLISQVVHWEAGGEDEVGQILVANVILNRLNHPNFQGTLSDVIFAPGAFTVTQRQDFGEATPSLQTFKAVEKAMSGVDHSHGATFFHAINKLHPEVWHERAVRDGRLVILFEHGNHRFYKEA